MGSKRIILAFAVLSLVFFATAKGEDVTKLIDQLGSWNKDKAKEASDKLAAIGKSVVPEVAKVVNEKSRRKGRFAVRTLREIGPDAADAIPELIEALDDSDALTREYAVEALAQMGRQADLIIPVLHKVANSKDENLREQARLAIKQLNEYSDRTKTTPQAESIRKDKPSEVQSALKSPDSTEVADDAILSTTHSSAKKEINWTKPVVLIRIAFLTFVIGGFFLLLHVYQE